MWPSKGAPQRGSFIRAQAESLRARGHRVDVLVVGSRAPKAWSYAQGLFELRRVVRGGGFDLIHAHYGHSIVLATLVSEVAVVGSYCGSDLLLPRERRMTAWAGRLVDAAIVKNAAMKRMLGRADAHVVPNGVDLGVFRPLDRAECRRALGLPADGRLVLFPYDPRRREKRHHLAQAAVLRLNASGVLDGRVELLTVYDARRDRYVETINACDAVVLVSESEGSPNVVKEALACNRPVVAVRVGDTPELLEGLAGSVLVDPDADAVARGLAHALRSGPSGEGRRAMSRLSSDRIACRIEEIYARALARHANRHD
jgi:glycosyltransferase involved in cell wall biosynthesis